MPVEVSCPCGMRSRGPDSLAGKQAKCPQCGQVLNIPPLQQAPVMLVPLEPLPQPVQRPRAPAQQPANQQLPPRQVPAWQMPPQQLPARQVPAPTPLPPAPAGYPSLGQASMASLPAYDPLQRAPQKPAESPGVPVGVWIGLGCAAGGAVLVVALAIVVVSMSSGPPVVAPDDLAAANIAPPTVPTPVVPAVVPTPIASAPTPAPVQGPATTTYPMSSSSGSASSTSVSGVPASSASPQPTTPSSPSPSSIASATSPMTPAELANALSSNLTGSTAADATSSGNGKAAMAILGPGVDRWRTSPQSNLRGMQRFPDKLHMYGYSWMVQLLPHLGHEKSYARFDFTKSWAEGDNLNMTSEVIPAFINPVDSRTRSKGYPISGMGLTHYVGMAGVEDARNVVAGELPRSDPRAGVFGYDEVARPEAITDGQSQTIMIIGSGNLPSAWVQGGGATVRGARAPYFDEITGFGTKGLSSPGAQVMMADGSTRAVSAKIDPMVFKAMCTIHGSDSVDLQSVPFIPAETK